jgi:hypothetical protein
MSATSHQPLPERLYKYLPPKGIRVLRSWTLRYTQPSHLNDPFEMRIPSVTPILDPLSGDLVDSLLDFDSQTIMYRQLDREFGILSLAADDASLLLWAHYAQGHSGFSIAFDTSHPSFHLLGEAKPVVYASTRASMHGHEPPEEAIGFFFVKSVDWQYEREWRIVDLLDHCRDLGNGIFVRDIDPACVAAVALGMATSRSLETRIRAALRGHPTIPIYRACLSSNSYSLAFVEADDPLPDYVIEKRLIRKLAFPGQEWALRDLGTGLLTATRSSKFPPEYWAT